MRHQIPFIGTAAIVAGKCAEINLLDPNQGKKLFEECGNEMATNAFPKCCVDDGGQVRYGVAKCEEVMGLDIPQTALEGSVNKATSHDICQYRQIVDIDPLTGRPGDFKEICTRGYSPEAPSSAICTSSNDPLCADPTKQKTTEQREKELDDLLKAYYEQNPDPCPDHDYVKCLGLDENGGDSGRGASDECDTPGTSQCLHGVGNFPSNNKTGNTGDGGYEPNIQYGPDQEVHCDTIDCAYQVDYNWDNAAQPIPDPRQPIGDFIDHLGKEIGLEFLLELIKHHGPNAVPTGPNAFPALPIGVGVGIILGEKHQRYFDESGGRFKQIPELRGCHSVPLVGIKCP